MNCLKFHAEDLHHFIDIWTIIFLLFVFKTTLQPIYYSAFLYCLKL